MKKVQLRYQHPRYAIVRRPPVRDVLMVATPPPSMSKVIAEERAVVFAPTMRSLLIAASQVAGVSVAEIISPRREKRLVRLRQCVMILARKYTPLSYPQIGRHLGGRDHSTIQHAIKLYAKKPEMFDKAMQAICDKINLFAPHVDNSEKLVSVHQNTDQCATVSL